MSSPAHLLQRDPGQTAFCHEAFLYSGDREFVEGAAPFLENAVAAGEPVLVMVAAPKIDLLRSALGRTADSVRFADMAKVGRNPARIIPAWREFAVRHAFAGGRLRGIGEPIWPGRSPAEIAEGVRHEALLNLAFADAAGFWLLCPYDADGLDPAVVADARLNHPFVCDADERRRSADYRADQLMTALEGALPEPAGQPLARVFGLAAHLGDLRALVAEHAAVAHLSPVQAEELVLAVNEVATNSLRHGGGQGVLRIWRDCDELICEIRDRGHIDNPLAGRERPAPGQVGGWGLWIVNQICDLVELCSSSAGTVVRLHKSCARPWSDAARPPHPSGPRPPV